jgi:tRNA-specific 2-thiouridylase
LAEAADNRVAVAMSGGVDSSVAALLLARQGFEVVGFTARLLDGDEGSRCCSLDATYRARRVCEALGAEHVTVNLEAEFRDRVIQAFVDEYRAGRTPNPCVDCNRFIKFDRFLKVADWLGCGFLATGHYARIDLRPRETFAPVDKRVGDTLHDGRKRMRNLLQLMRGVDREKDQSYFVAVITRGQLERVMFPCGEITKVEARKLAAEAGFPTVEAEESQDACFLTPGKDVEYWVRALAGEPMKRGEIVGLNGEKLGEHAGIERFTRGQRKGLGVGGGPPLYVVDIEPENARVVAGEAGSRPIADIALTQVNLLAEGYTKGNREVMVRTRYRQQEKRAVLEELAEDTLRVRFASPQEFISPGQWCVFYDRELVIGCGMIDRIGYAGG